LTALAQRRLPKLGSVTVPLLLVGARPAVSASITPLSTITTSIINFREITISGIITAGVTTARVTTARAPVALGISAALMSATALAAALAEHAHMKFRACISSFGPGTFVSNGTAVTCYGQYPLI
jgi:hypothetical protein